MRTPACVAATMESIGGFCFFFLRRGFVFFAMLQMMTEADPGGPRHCR
jgi:hypothetical protein